MSVRNPHVRQNRNKIFINYQGQSFMLIPGDFQEMPIVYKTKKELLKGSIIIPDMGAKKGLGTILITCYLRVDGGHLFDWI